MQKLNYFENDAARRSPSEKPVGTPKEQNVNIVKYGSLYELQFKASQLVSERKVHLDKRKYLSEAASLHTTILQLIKSYQELNRCDQSLTHQ